jgi:23S rRNA (uracil1939-C5)-methyltransferase
VIYVSCNPATQARDLKLLNENGYDLQSLQPLDMFPQTEHIETIGLLRRR